MGKPQVEADPEELIHIKQLQGSTRNSRAVEQASAPKVNTQRKDCCESYETKCPTKPQPLNFPKPPCALPQVCFLATVNCLFLAFHGRLGDKPLVATSLSFAAGFNVPGSMSIVLVLEDRNQGSLPKWIGGWVDPRVGLRVNGNGHTVWERCNRSKERAHLHFASFAAFDGSQLPVSFGQDAQVEEINHKQEPFFAMHHPQSGMRKICKAWRA